MGTLMIEVNSSEFIKNIGKYKEIAQYEPVIITKHNRKSLVLISVRKYEELTTSLKMK